MRSSGSSSMQPLGHGQILDALFICQSLFILSYMISAIFQFSNVYNGFNAIFLGIIFLGTVICSYLYLRKNVTKVMYGILLGATFMLIFISLQSAIFWGQYSDCESYHLDGKSGNPPMCENTPAMESICTFSVFMFLSYSAQLVIMIVFKHEILGALPTNALDNNHHQNLPYMPLENLLEAIKPRASTNPASEESLFEYSYDLDDDQTTIASLSAQESPTLHRPVKQFPPSVDI